MNRATSLLVLAVLAAVPAAAVDYERLAPDAVLVRNATIWTQTDRGVLEGHDLLIRDGKIARIGENLSAPRGALEIDGSGKHVTPGLIDCHSHTAIRGGVNEGSNNITAEVRIADVIEPDDVNLYRQLAGGLTAAHLLHGSANSIGGQDAVIKLRRDATRESLLIPTAKPGIKFALGENPKRSNFRRPGEPRYPATRMGVMESIRERFAAARAYQREWERYEALSDRERERVEPPRRDLQLEAIAEILRGDRIIHSHSYRQDEILALMRTADDFGVTIGTFQHVLEGYKVADELAAHGAGASTFSDWWAYKLEAYDAIPFNGALMHERGVLVTFNSDSSELARRMNLESAKAVRYGGVDPQEALNFVTLNAAKQLRIDDRTGSLVPGKDADFVIWSGDPLSVYSIAEQTWVDGVREFDRAADLEARAAVEQERAERIAEIRDGKKKQSDDRDEAEKKDEDKGEKKDEPVKPRGEVPPLVDLAYRDRLASTGPAVSIVGATVHTVSGGTIENGTVSFREGRIVEVGAGLPPLPGARVVEARGLHVYPGMIDVNTAVGLTEINSVAGSVDIAETGDINPNANTAISVNPDSELIDVTRAAGLTHVLSVPGGGLVSGTSALIRLDGWTWEDLAAATPAALHVRWPSFSAGRRFGRGPSPEEREQQREENLRQIRELFAAARAYAKAKAAGRAPLDPDPKLEAMLPVLDGRVRVVVHAGEIRQINSAVKWSEEEGVRIALAGDGDLWRVADMLAEKKIPVILTSVLSLPSREDEPYDTAYTEAAKLHQAGVEFCIASSGGGFGAAMTRNLPHHAAMASAFGLPREVALRAVTVNPARILGVGDALGSIEPGKSASLIVTDGDPLEIRTQVLRGFIDGREVDLGDNRHQRLYERYRGRPHPPAGGE